MGSNAQRSIVTLFLVEFSSLSVVWLSLLRLPSPPSAAVKLLRVSAGAFQ